MEHLIDNLIRRTFQLDKEWSRLDEDLGEPPSSPEFSRNAYQVLKAIVVAETSDVPRSEHALRAEYALDRLLDVAREPTRRSFMGAVLPEIRTQARQDLEVLLSERSDFFKTRPELQRKIRAVLRQTH